jgi:hypothetical protein
MNRTLRAVCATTFCGLLGTPLAASAAFGDPEIRAGFSAGYNCYADDRRYHGLGGALDLQYAFGPTWAVISRYGFGAHHIREAAFRLQQLTVGGRFQLDVFEYVPWLELAPGAYLSGGEGGPKDDFSGGVRAGLGFDRLLNERAAITFGAHYHQLFGESRFPAYLEVHLGFDFRWSLGDPLAP